MITPRSMVLWDRPRRRRIPRRPSARSLAWRVELLEERFLLANQLTGDVWYSLPVGSTPSYVDQSVLSDVSSPQTPPDASDPTVVSSIEIAFGSVVASPGGFFAEPIPEKTSIHSTLLAAQDIPPECAATILGTFEPGGEPDVFRVTLLTFPSDELFISLSWADPNVTGLGTLTILDSSAHVLLEQGLPSDPLAIDLRFSHVSATPGASLYVKIAATSKPAWDGREAADYVLKAAPTALIPSALVTNEYEGTTGAGSTTDPPSAPSDPPPPVDDSSSVSPFPAPAPAPSPVDLPLPQAVSAPAGGIFVTQHMLSATAGGVVAVVADPHMLDLAPVRSTPRLITVGAARVITVHLGRSPTPNTSFATSWGAEGGSDELVADLDDESAPSQGTEPSRLVLALPPSGIRSPDRAFPDPAAAAWLDDRAALPRLADEPMAPAPARPCASTAASPVRSRRPGALLTLLYGSICSLLGLSAPELSVALRKAARSGLDSELVLSPDRRAATGDEEGAG